MQDQETTNFEALTDLSAIPSTGRLLAIDLGTKRCGIAVSDELRVTVRPVATLTRKSWKKLLTDVKQFVSRFDAAALIIGLPLESDGTESPMSVEARRLAHNFALSLSIPVILQDERVTSYEARRRLWLRGLSLADTLSEVDAMAAAVILEDVLERFHSSTRR